MVIRMSRFVLLVVDIALMTFATLAAFILHENFEVSEARLLEFLPYLAATAVAALAMFSAAGLNSTVRRYFAHPDYWRVMGAVAAIVCAAAAIGFAYNRLDGVPRSLPVLQLLAGQAILLGARALHRVGRMAREDGKTSAALLELPSTTQPAHTVVVVGISRLTETYLQAAAELAPGRIKIAGLVGRSGRNAGRLAANYPVLGVPEDIEHILNALALHGVHADRIVVAAQFETLSPEAQEALLCAGRSRNIPLHFLAGDLGLKERNCSGAKSCELSVEQELSFELPPAELTLLASRPYWRTKRAFDAAAAFVLLIASAPLLLITAVCVAASMGLPTVFWQQQPGLGGKPFRLYKFRTMRTALSPDGRRLAGGQLETLIGAVLRRLRLDELPQLFNILRGDMSFAGPRPLLARAQQDAYRIRLLVRPGLTGSAQAIGGRDISFEDKAALDVWYVRNASMALDVEIALRTILILLFGERVFILDRAGMERSR